MPICLSPYRYNDYGHPKNIPLCYYLCVPSWHQIWYSISRFIFQVNTFPLSVHWGKSRSRFDTILFLTLKVCICNCCCLITDYSTKRRLPNQWYYRWHFWAFSRREGQWHSNANAYLSLDWLFLSPVALFKSYPREPAFTCLWGHCRRHWWLICLPRWILPRCTQVAQFEQILWRDLLLFCRTNVCHDSAPLQLQFVHPSTLAHRQICIHFYCHLLGGDLHKSCW